MKICRIAVILLPTVALTGCLTTANLIKHPHEVKTNSQYAPESEKQSNGIGIVNYLNEGAEFVRNSRREDAYKKAFESCGGQYEILDETANYTNPMYVSNISGNSITTSGYSSQYRFIYFKCK